MRVLCIDLSHLPSCSGCGYPDTDLKEGMECNVSQCLIHPNSFKVSEQLNCPKCSHRWSFKKSRFIPLSEIDEIELVNIKELTNA